MRAKRGSFTLIEVLIVMTIVVIMAALLLPSLQSAKDRGYQAKCMNNLRQIGIGINLYGHDHGFYMWGIESNTVAEWSYRISPYLGKTNGDTYAQGHNNRSPVIECPKRSLYNNLLPSCYGVHHRIFGDTTQVGFNSPPTYPRAYPFDQRSSELLMAADADQSTTSLPRNANATIWNHPPGTLFDTDYDPTTANNPVDPGDNSDAAGALSQIRWRHANRANILFVDGHVSSLGMDQLLERNVRFTGP